MDQASRGFNNESPRPSKTGMGADQAASCHLEVTRACQSGILWSFNHSNNGRLSESQLLEKPPTSSSHSPCLSSQHRSTLAGALIEVWPKRTIRDHQPTRAPLRDSKAAKTRSPLLRPQELGGDVKRSSRQEVIIQEEAPFLAQSQLSMVLPKAGRDPLSCLWVKWDIVHRCQSKLPCATLI